MSGEEAIKGAIERISVLSEPNENDWDDSHGWDHWNDHGYQNKGGENNVWRKGC